MFSSVVSRVMITLGLILLFSHFARAAPAGFDYATLLKNGQEAQRLNAQYITLSMDDACVESQKGCVDDVPAQCTNGKWSLAATGCPDTQHCFALPSVRQSGTFVACTSEANALSIIAATGAEGGVVADSAPISHGENSTSIAITGSSSSSSTSTRRSTTSSSTGSSSVPSSSSAASSSHGPVVVTKTMTLAPGSTMILAPTTLTLAQASASAMLSSLLANGASIISVIHPTPTPTTRA